MPGLLQGFDPRGLRDLAVGLDGAADQGRRHRYSIAQRSVEASHEQPGVGPLFSGHSGGNVDQKPAAVGRTPLSVLDIFASVLILGVFFNRIGDLLKDPDIDHLRNLKD